MGSFSIAEKSAVQSPLLRYAEEAGWQYLSPEEAANKRGGPGQMILKDVLTAQVQLLNPILADPRTADEALTRLKRISPTIEGNLEAWEYLQGLKTVFVPHERRERNLILLSPRWQDNQYHVTDELTYDNGSKRIRLDVAFFINGIPVLLIETKAASKLDGIAEALEQVRRYHREGPELLALIQLFSLTHLVQYYYGATWSISKKGLFNWRDELAGANFEDLVKTFLHPQRVVRLIQEFILFTRSDDLLSKVVLRPHQMRAVERIVKRVADPEVQRGLIWHTQGSGKTFTMIVAAKQIIQNPAFENPTVLMLVDRNELAAQLFGNLTSVGFSNFVEAGSKRKLRDFLASDQRGLIISMIHKFDDIPANINTRKNIFVLVDEAHRTTGGDLGNYLMGALPNATYIGFTGTPIDKTAQGKGTFKVFGAADPKGYLDKYSIAQSVEDGTTVRLNYSLAPSELRVDRETLDAEFLNLAEAEGISDQEELDVILSRAVNLKNMLKNHDRMVRVAKYVADHFLTVVEPMGYKAFLVAPDREACAWYKDLLDQHLPTEYSAVVYSPAHNDNEDLQRYYLGEDQEKQIRKDFRSPEKLPKILIVTEKLLTGYDAPILYCMYLDKPMRDHVLLQAIARVNRPYEDTHGLQKPAGFVLDFVGIFENLEKALAFDSADVSGVVADIELLKGQFEKLMVKVREEYLPIAVGKTVDKAAENVLQYFSDEELRHGFYRFYKELADLYEILSPDAYLRPFIHDYEQVTRMYLLLRAAYESILVDKELTRKTARLVQEHTHGGEIDQVFEIYQIDEKLIQKLGEDNSSDTVKVFNLLKSIEQAVSQKNTIAPYLITIGERAELIAQAYHERQMTTKEALEHIELLIAEINAAEAERVQSEMDPMGFTIYWLMKDQKVPRPVELSSAMDKTFKEYPHWQVSPEQERYVRRALYYNLYQNGVEDLKARKSDELVDVTEFSKLVEMLLVTIRKAGDKISGL